MSLWGRTATSPTSSFHPTSSSRGRAVFSYPETQAQNCRGLRTRQDRPQTSLEISCCRPQPNVVGYPLTCHGCKKEKLSFLSDRGSAKKQGFGRLKNLSSRWVMRTRRAGWPSQVALLPPDSHRRHQLMSDVTLSCRMCRRPHWKDVGLWRDEFKETGKGCLFYSPHTASWFHSHVTLSGVSCDLVELLLM